jgi:dipeptidyl-peptidase III
VERLNMPSYTGFVQPKLTAVRNDAGEIVDVEISYLRDFTRQMLEYSGRGRQTRRARTLSALESSCLEPL